MNLKEYKRRIADIDAECDERRKDVAREYARSHNSIAVGDIIEDTVGKIRVDSILYTYSAAKIPICVYRGHEMRKDGKPKARPSIRDVYQNDKIVNHGKSI